VLTACNSAEQKNRSTSSARTAQPAAPVFADGVRRITPVELRDMLARNEAVVIDVRNDEAYNTAHIKGAKLIPETDVAKRSDELPKNKLIVTYCS
jgi:predicted sulfurtransferase